MLNLVRADLYRIFHGKLIKVSCFLTIGWVLLCSYAQKATLDIREYLTGSEVTADYWNAFFQLLSCCNSIGHFLQLFCIK